MYEKYFSIVTVCETERKSIWLATFPGGQILTVDTNLLSQSVSLWLPENG